MIPNKISQSVLDRQAGSDDVVAVVVTMSGGGLGTFVVQGRGSLTFAFQFDKKRGCHVLRFPASVWAARRGELARELFDQPSSGYPMIPTVEPWDASLDLSALSVVRPKSEPVELVPDPPSNDVAPSGVGLVVGVDFGAEALAEARDTGSQAFASGEECPFTEPSLSALQAAWQEGYEAARIASGAATVDVPRFRIVGTDIMEGDERVGGLFDPGNHLRMAPGRKDLRELVEDFLTTPAP